MNVRDEVKTAKKPVSVCFESINTNTNILCSAEGNRAFRVVEK